MKSKLKTILLVLAVLLVGFIIVVATRPADFKVTRSATLDVPPAAVFAQVNNLHRWEDWSPWAKLDPNAKSTYAGPEEGVGASMSWAGNNDVGEGTMSIQESRPDELVRFKLEFKKPMEGTSFAEFTFQPQDGKTVVTWTMTGQNNFVAKAFSLFVDCDKMMGGYFEKGLAQLKTVSETAAKK